MFPGQFHSPRRPAAMKREKKTRGKRARHGKMNRKNVESPQDVKVTCDLQESQVETCELASC